ncbi:MAG TPA: hypothetical protein DF712_00745, partial [Balneola sp.]|nr:hypothetical protein [Balneola sp.]
MSFNKIPLRSIIQKYENKGFRLSLFMEKSGLSHILKRGGIIGGGFARQLVLGLDIAAYLGINFDSYRVSNTKPGDIDVFFQTRAVYNRAVAYYNNMINNEINCRKHSFDLYDVKLSANSPVLVCAASDSLSGFCKNISLVTSPQFLMSNVKPNPYHHNKEVKIQLVGEFLGDVKAISETYDLTNVKAFISGDYLVYHDRLLELESAKVIEISNENSPLLAQRVQKYLTHRGLDSLTCESTKSFTKWICRARAGEWNNHPLGSLFDDKSVPLSYVRNLINRSSVVSTNSLSLLIGKFIEQRCISRRRYMPSTY